MGDPFVEQAVKLFPDPPVTTLETDNLDPEDLLQRAITRLESAGPQHLPDQTVRGLVAFLNQSVWPVLKKGSKHPVAIRKTADQILRLFACQHLPSLDVHPPPSPGLPGQAKCVS